MDDGSLSHQADQEDRALFATCGFDESSVNTLIGALERNGVKGAAKYRSSGWRIRLNAEAAEQLFLLIAPYVPEVMQYKLPERYRGGAAGFPRVFGRFKPMIRPQTVRLVEHWPTAALARHGRADNWRNHGYGLITATHNLFANGMLIHDSTFTCDEAGG